MSTELERERDTLAQSLLDMAAGERRVDRQCAMNTEMKAKGLDTRQGERLLEVLQDTLAQWARHHTMIIERIVYLERKEGIPEAVLAAPLKL